MSYAKLVGAMYGKAASVDELVAQTGLSRHTVADYIRALRRERLAHIAEWQKDSTGRTRIARHAMGRFPDAPKPVVSRREIERNRKARKEREEAFCARSGGTENAGNGGSHQGQ